MWSTKTEIQDTLHRYYHFYEEDDPPGYLHVTYKQQGRKTKLSAIRDQDDKIIEFVHVFINKIPACYLKGFKSSILPEIEESIRFRCEGGNYFLNFEGRWDWYSKGREVEQLKIQVRWEKESIIVEMPSCCRMLWIKKVLEKEVGTSRNDPYLLFYKNLPLEDTTTVAEYGLNETDLIEAARQSDLTEGPSSLQMGTGGGYHSIEEFEKYVAQMREKINIVCQISIPKGYKTCEYGTGFLIGHSLIMTNQHVVQGSLEGAKAKFFYHGNALDEIDIAFYPESVCESQSPGNQLPTQSHLDYAILRLCPTSRMTSKQLEILQGLNFVAEQFFDKALERYEKKDESLHLPLIVRKKEEDARLNRANIIQHPLLQETKSDELHPQPKQIAFRDNSIHSYDNLMLHYPSETKPGSSGSPVINDLGEWIGLHYSACNVLKIKLYGNVEKLCALLGYEYNKDESDDRALCFIKKERKLYVYCNQEQKGLCSYEGDTKKFTLRELIKQECEEVISGKMPITKFILSFLESQGETKSEGHLLCNTAIIVDSIFKDLKENGAEKQIKIIEARDLADKEWSIFTKLPDQAREAYVGMSQQERTHLAQLPEEERSCYCELNREDRVLFVELSENDRYHFMRFSPLDRHTFIRIPEEQRPHYITMTKLERKFFNRLDRLDRKYYIQMSTEHRAYYREMERSKRYRFMLMSEQERTNYINSKRPILQKYKWPLIAGCVFIAVGVIYFKWRPEKKA